MKIYSSTVLALLVLGLACSVQASERHGMSNAMTVRKESSWVLVGEWDLPKRTVNEYAHYTLSIIEMDGKYFRVDDGNLIAGCCFWPVVHKVEKLSASTYSDADSESTYLINEDGALSIFKKDGAELKADRTARETMFSNGWRSRLSN